MNSSQSTFDGKFGIARADRHQRQLVTGRASTGLRSLLSTFAFWSAIALPAFYLPLLVGGIETVDRLGLFLDLFGLHVLALVGGRRRHLERR